MKKVYLILAAVAGMTITSCTTNDYLGEDPGVKAVENVISFGGGTSKMTRASFENSDAATRLNNEMKVYGVKQDRTTTTKYDGVFTNYVVKYNTEKQGYDEYNNGWYYVGAESNQYIKYWDYSSADYHFVAGSPVANFTYATDGNGDITTATVTGLGGRLTDAVSVTSSNAAVYVADPKVVAKANYKNEVEFTFRSMQSKVRVGIYETIPGYKITDIKFYNNAATPVSSQFITLNSATDNYFQGGSSVTGTVTYNWTTPGYEFAYETSGLTQGKYWEGGQFTTGVPATSSAEATADNLYGTETDHDTKGYFIVMPTPSSTTAAPLTLTCDYTLTSLDPTAEDIKVTGATATIPATYTKWAANTAYTYLFKISDNTNGTTGDPSDPSDPAGLYPITFDAVVVNVEDNKWGTETTVSTPSITVYQNGNVVEKGITYAAGAVTVMAYEGETDVTTKVGTTWNYVELDSFNYGSDYEKLGTSGAATTWTPGKLSSVTSGKTYVIKCTTASGTAYFVLVVGSAEAGPANS